MEVPGTLFICDRCETEEFAKQGSDAVEKWHRIKHIYADGKESEYLLCKDCYKKHYDRALQLDKDHNVWMGTR